MSYDPSRRPPRQERWPSATPAEGWPSYQDADAYRGGEWAGHQYEADRTAAYPGTRHEASYHSAAGESGDRGYRSPVAIDTFSPAGNGYGYPAGGYPGDGRAWGGDGYATDGFDGTVNGYGEDRYGYADAADGYAGVRNGYAGTLDGYPATADGFGGTRDGFGGTRDGFGGTRDGYEPAGNGCGPAENAYGPAEDGYWQAGNGYGQAVKDYDRAEDGYGQAEDDYDWAQGGHRPGSDGYADDLDGYGWEPGRSGTTADGYAGGPNDLGPGSYTEYNEHLSGDPRLMAPDADVHPDTWQAEQDSRREARRRGMLVGGVTVVLGTAVAIGVSTLVAGLLKAQTSPAAAMGSVFIDRTPAGLRSALAGHFGAHSQTVLLLGMYAAIALVALVTGVSARGSAALGVASIGAFTLVAAFVTITRPASHAGDVIPAIVGGIAGAAAVLWLVRASAPPQPTAPPRTAPPRPARGGARRRTR